MTAAVVVANQPAVTLYDAAGVELAVKDGIAIPANTPRLLIAGTDATLVRTLRTAADGTVRTDPTGTTVQPVSVSSIPLPAGAATEATLATRASEATLAAFASIAATESTLAAATNILGDIRSSSGIERIDQPVTVIGPAAEAASASNNPVRIGGWDGTNIRTLRTDTLGRLIPYEEASFMVLASDVVLGNNKSLLSLYNADATLKVKLQEVWLLNTRTSAVTGVVATFELRKFTTAHSAGTVLTPVASDSTDSLDADITARTGATIAGEQAIYLRRLWSTDDWGSGSLDTEGYQVGVQNSRPFWEQRPNVRPLVLNQNQGVHVKCATNTTAGVFDVMMLFTQV